MDGNSFTYPDSNIDPRLKNEKWILQYCKAAYYDGRGYAPMNPVNAFRAKMAEIKMYAMGKQSIQKYKKLLLPDEQTDNSWLTSDWNPLALLCKYREIAISKLVQRRYDIQASAVDALAKSEEDLFFDKMKVKILMRQKAKEMGSELADNPLLMPEPNEPQDMDALEMEAPYSYKHVMSMEAESAIDLIMQQNDIDERRKRTNEYNFDYGIGGYTEYIDENGMVKVEELDPEMLLLSYCTKNDFSDLTHWGYFREIYVGDLVPYFTREQLDTIIKTVAGKYGNQPYFAWDGTADLSSYYNRFKVLVLDFKFKNWNTTFYKEEVDGRGNVRFNKTKFKNMAVNTAGTLEEQYEQPMSETGETGAAEPKFSKITKAVVYKCMWVVNTDFVYNYGLSENMVRKPSNWWDTSLDIQLYAWNFYRMQWTGITERLIPLADQGCLIWLRMQNLANKLVPYIMNVDFNALESVSFGKGGKAQDPAEIMDFILSNFVAPYRSTDLLSRNPNYKPVSIEPSGQLQAFVELRNELATIIDMMRQISGLNEVTDGSTINPRNLNSTNAGMMESTNNALYLLMNADKRQMTSLADSIIAKVQIAVKLGKVAGYRKALGFETVSFLEINPNISIHEFGIFLEDSPSEEERQMFWQSLTAKEYQGLIEPQDKILIMSCRNLKQADMLLAYRIKKRKEEMRLFEMQKIQENNQGQTQMALAIEQAKQQTIMLQGQVQIEAENVKGQWNYVTEQMKKQSDQIEAGVQADAKALSSKITGEAKIIAQEIQANAKIQSDKKKEKAA